MQVRRIAAAIAVAVVAAALVYARVADRAATGDGPATLYGNVDIRQVDLAFNVSGRLARMAKEEGDPVAAGEEVARVEAEIYEHAVALATARVAASRAAYTRLQAGSRPEEIELARAQLASERAALVNAQAVFERRQDLVTRDIVARQAFDEARAALDIARGRVAAAEQTLALAIQGPRREDLDQAQATLQADEAALAIARHNLDRTRLTAPSAGIVLTRIVEPGTVVLPTSAVYTVALTDQVWVRSYVPEPMLGRVRPGLVVQVATDARPGRPYQGVVGFVAPTAEFTPRTVETPELRTQLVYRLRINIRDPDPALRQGMPVTVLVPAGR